MFPLDHTIIEKKGSKILFCIALYQEGPVLFSGESMFPFEWLNEGLPKGNQVTEETTCLPDQDSQDNTRRVYK